MMGDGDHPFLSERVGSKPLGFDLHFRFRTAQDGKESSRPMACARETPNEEPGRPHSWINNRTSKSPGPSGHGTSRGDPWRSPGHGCDLDELGAYAVAGSTIVHLVVDGDGLLLGEDLPQLGVTLHRIRGGGVRAMEEANDRRAPLVWLRRLSSRYFVNLDIGLVDIAEPDRRRISAARKVAVVIDRSCWNWIRCAWPMAPIHRDAADQYVRRRPRFDRRDAGSDVVL